MSTHRRRTQTEPAGAPPAVDVAPMGGLERTLGWLCALAIVLVGAGVYANSLHGAFVLDDELQIVNNGDIRQIGPAGKYLDLHRPLHRLSIAVNYAVTELDTWGYHLFNIAVHLITALALFGVVRRTLRMGPLAERFGRAATPLALAVATIWVVHPLNTGAVTYVIQRTESLMGMFFVLAFYCAIRGFGSPHRVWWYALAVASCAASVLSKEVAVVLPLLLLLYDMVFVERRLKRVLRRRWGLYLAFFLTWALIGIRMLLPDTGIAAQDIALRHVTRWDYLFTQPAAILQYLRLTFWPHPLQLDYFWLPAKWPWGVVPHAAVVVGLLAATGLALWKAPRWGFLGAWFFVILAPTSSLLPIADLIFEHRMYLPLMAIVTGVCVGAFLAIRAAVGRFIGDRSAIAPTSDGLPRETYVNNPPRERGVGLPSPRPPGNPRLPAGAIVLEVLLAVAIIGTLAFLTISRNEDYSTEEGMWRDVIAKAPHNPRAHNNLGKALYFEHKADLAGGKNLGKLDEAMGCYSQAINAMEKIQPPGPGVGYADPYYNYGLACSDKAGAARDPVSKAKWRTDAMYWYEQALIIKPEMGPALNNTATLYLEMSLDERGAAQAAGQSGQLDKAKEHLEKEKEYLDKAIASFRKAIENDPANTLALGNLSRVYMRTGHFAAAIPHLKQILYLARNESTVPVGLYQDLGVSLARSGRHREAVREFQIVLAANPEHVGATGELAWLRATSTDDGVRNGAEAVRLAEKLLRPPLDRQVTVIRAVAAAYAEAGQFDQAADITRRAMTLAAEGAQTDLVAVLQQYLKAFEAGRPIRDGPAPPPR